MPSPFHELVVFGQLALPFRVAAQVALEGQCLVARFRVTGETSGILLAAPEPKPMRQNGLWEKTCFEVFLKPTNGAAYWEFNFSPARNWAAYHFTSYRTGRTDEVRVSDVVIRALDASRDFAQWDVTADLSQVTELKSQKNLSVGLTSVIQTQDGQKTYWALSHSGEKPDFHREEGFIALQ